MLVFYEDVSDGLILLYFFADLLVSFHHWIFQTLFQ
jgi:hypothetical protein